CDDEEVVDCNDALGRIDLLERIDVLGESPDAGEVARLQAPLGVVACADRIARLPAFALALRRIHRSSLESFAGEGGNGWRSGDGDGDEQGGESKSHGVTLAQQEPVLSAP